jgi:hypothetical protein
VSHRVTQPVLLAAALLALTCACAQDEIAATVKEERLPERDAGREGLQMVKRSLALGNVAFRYQQLVDPKQQDRPLNQRYADYILGCEFPRGTWNWDLQYFLEVTVARPDEKPFIANRALLQEGIFILQQGQRGVADMVWPLPTSATRPQPGRLAVRFVKLPDEPAWLYLRVSLEGEPDTKITQVQLSSYPTVTSGPPERQRWAATLTRTMQMGQPVPLDPAAEWAVVMHNRYAHEDGGSLLVMDPDQVETADIGGTYPVSVRMNTKPLSAATFALGYFWDTPYAKAIAAFVPEAPERLQRLRALDWTVPVDLPRWQQEQADVAEVLALAGSEAGDHAEQWQQLQTDMKAVIAALRQPNADSAACRQFVLLTRQAAELKAALYEPALLALIKQATQ